MSVSEHQAGDVLSDVFAKANDNALAIRELGRVGDSFSPIGRLRVAAVTNPAQLPTSALTVQQWDGTTWRNRWRIGVPFHNSRVAHFNSFTTGVKLSTSFKPTRVYVQVRHNTPPGPVADSHCIMFESDGEFDVVQPVAFLDTVAAARTEAAVTCDFDDDGVTITLANDPNGFITFGGVTVLGELDDVAGDDPASEPAFALIPDAGETLETGVAKLNAMNDAIRAMVVGDTAPEGAPLYSLWANTDDGYVYQLTDQLPDVWTKLWPIGRADAIHEAETSLFSFGVPQATTGFAPQAVLVSVEFDRQGDGTVNLRDSLTLLFVNTASSGTNNETIAVGQAVSTASNLTTVTIGVTFSSGGVTVNKTGGAGTALASVTAMGLVMFS